MSRIIKVNKWLDCGCCGEDFRTWQGYKDQDQDDGYGICHSCQADIAVKDTQEMDKLIATVKTGLKAESLAIYEAKSREEQEQFAMHCLDKGFVSFNIVPA